MFESNQWPLYKRSLHQGIAEVQGGGGGSGEGMHALVEHFYRYRGRREGANQENVENASIEGRGKLRNYKSAPPTRQENASDAPGLDDTLPSGQARVHGGPRGAMPPLDFSFPR